MDSIHLRGFSLEILTGYPPYPVEKIIYNHYNYYGLPHNTIYNIRLGNYHDVRVDAHVWVHGHKVGMWSIAPYSKITIRTPRNSRRKFILRREHKYFVRGPEIMGDPMHGLIKVIFIPEVEQTEKINKLNKYPRYIYETQNYTDTVTPYTHGHRIYPLMHNAYMRRYIRKYKYVIPEPKKTIGKINKDLITTIYARLVVDDDITTYKRKYIGIRHAGFSDKAPPKLHLQHPSRPHRCNVDSPFTLSRKYWFDTR